MTGARLDTPNVSVLIPAFNMDRVLETAVASALDQDGVTVEVVVIDDASTDGTPDLVAGMARKDARVHPVRLQENAGPGAARSAGLAQARGDWVAVLDADDRFAPGRLAHLLALARARNLDAVADNLTLVDPGLGRAVGRAFPLEEEAEITLTAERFLANSVPGARVNVGWAQPMVRRDFLERHGVAWPSLRHAEDMVFAMRLLMAGARWGLSGRAGYFYTQRRGTVSGQTSALSRTRRSVTDQQRAVAMVLAEGKECLRPAVLRRLRLMPAEIAATHAAILARDAAAEGRWGAAAGHGLAALTRPAAFARCLAARFGPGAQFK
ncbi:MAG: glycosyltransferase family 2 protein [Rhodobacteraceae bacterium]|nr:glycosyltransferase family 2 protein [Paracoccaceae bacterium]